MVDAGAHDPEGVLELLERALDRILELRRAPGRFGPPLERPQEMAALPLVREPARELLEVGERHHEDEVRRADVGGSQPAGAVPREVEPGLSADGDRVGRRRGALDAEETGGVDDDVRQTRVRGARSEVGGHHRRPADVPVADDEHPHFRFFSQMRRSPSSVR